MGCGCKERKEIMFDIGKPGRTEAIIVAIAVTALMGAIIYSVKG